MQALLEHRASIDKLAAMANRSQHRRDHVGLGPTTRTLAQQPDQRGAVAIVGLEPPRPELAASRGGLRRREQPQRSRPAPLDLSRPRAMQSAGRLQANHRRPANTAGRDQPLELVDALAQHGQRHRLTDQTLLPGRQPHPIERLARIHRDDQRRRWHLSAQQVQEKSPSPKTKEKDPPGQRQGGAFLKPVFADLSAARARESAPRARHGRPGRAPPHSAQVAPVGAQAPAFISSRRTGNPSCPSWDRRLHRNQRSRQDGGPGAAQAYSHITRAAPTRRASCMPTAPPRRAPGSTA